MESLLLALTITFALPYLIWRLGHTEFYAPLVVVQIVTGIILGPGVLGALWKSYYEYVFTPTVIAILTGLGGWAVMLFVFFVGVEIDVERIWHHRRETTITAGMALGVPLLLGSVAGVGLILFPGWVGGKAQAWQFVVGVGMACAVTALPILVLLLEKLEVLRSPIGRRVLRYASLDDVAIWGVLALVLVDWQRIVRQAIFLFLFALGAFLLRKLMHWLPERDRWYVLLIWLSVCGFSADWSGLHYMVGAFLAGLVVEAGWFNRQVLDGLRHNVLLVLMPVFFLSTGLRTTWALGGVAVLGAAALLSVASVGGKLIGLQIVGRILKWKAGEASVIGWLLQTKALIMIIFANVLLDASIISGATFTALLLMAVASTMLTIPMVTPRLRRLIVRKGHVSSV